MFKKSFLLLFTFLTIISVSFSQNYFGWGYKTFDTSIPSSWSQESVVGNALWYRYGGLYTPYEGSGNVYFCVWTTVGNDIGEETFLITESFTNVGIENTFVGFWHHQVDFGGNNNELEVYYRVSPIDDWVLMQAYPDPIAEWTEENLYFPEQSATMQIGFKGILVGGENTEGIALDFVSLQYSDNDCLAPTNLAVSDITTTSVFVNWEENGSATTWSLEYGEHNYTQGTGTQINGINTNPEHTITGLTTNFQYDIYVRADCGAEQSEWVGPVSFFTDCNVVTDFPYLEPFNGSSSAELACFLVIIG